MQIENHQPNAALRLVHPPQADATGQAAASASPEPQKAEATRRYSFEAVYVERLPRVDVGEAQRRVERIRNELVAGQTPVPIHFEGSPVRPAHLPNPYADAYMKLSPAPADAHSRATEAAAE